MDARRILILCTGNSCRSQMAAALVNHDLRGQWLAESAGTHPAPAVHPLAIEVMAELGIDISAQRPRSVAALQGESYDLVMTVCADAAADCPVWLGRERTVRIGFDDPAQATGSPAQILDEFRRVRDEIRQLVVDYLTHTA